MPWAGRRIPVFDNTQKISTVNSNVSICPVIFVSNQWAYVTTTLTMRAKIETLNPQLTGKITNLPTYWATAPSFLFLFLLLCPVRLVPRANEYVLRTSTEAHTASNPR